METSYLDFSFIQTYLKLLIITQWSINKKLIWDKTYSNFDNDSRESTSGTKCQYIEDFEGKKWKKSKKDDEK